MHLRGRLCNDNRVLSAEAVDRMHDDRIEAVYAGDAGVGTGYGMGWWVDRASAGSLTKGPTAPFRRSTSTTATTLTS
jgi:hypothetical protein